MASVLFSSSRKDTEKLRGVQLYSRTSSLSRLRSAPPQKSQRRRVCEQSLSNSALNMQFLFSSPSGIPTSGFFTMDEWLSQHVPGWFVQLLHIHLPALRLKVPHDLFHSSQAFHCFGQLLNTPKSWRKNCRQLWFRYTLQWKADGERDGQEMSLVLGSGCNRTKQTAHIYCLSVSVLSHVHSYTAWTVWTSRGCSVATIAILHMSNESHLAFHCE